MFIVTYDMKRKRGRSPIISGVKRANSVLVDSSEFSSGIYAFEPTEEDYKMLVIDRNDVR